jgi:hypothetical protein
LPCGPGVLFFFHCVNCFCFAPRVARQLGAGSPPLAARQGSSGCDRAGTSRGGDPSLFACSRASDTPARDARSGSAACGGMAASPEGRRVRPPSRNALSLALWTNFPIRQRSLCRLIANGGVAVHPPRGPREPSRRSVRAPSGQTGGWRRWPRPELSVEGGEQRGSARRAVPARSHAQAGRRAGLEAQPERLLQARGAKRRSSHAVRRKQKRRVPEGHKRTAARSEEK